MTTATPASQRTVTLREVGPAGRGTRPDEVLIAVSPAVQLPRTYQGVVEPSSYVPCPSTEIHDAPGVVAAQEATSSVAPKSSS
jgi:hypothetical protein